MKTRVVPASELSAKTLRARSYMPKPPKPKARKGIVYAVKLEADNDCNGNPRRCWLVYGRMGTFLRTIDEGYAGYGALRELYPNVIVLCVVHVPSREYRESMQMQGEHGKAVPS